MMLAVLILLALPSVHQAFVVQIPDRPDGQDGPDGPGGPDGPVRPDGPDGPVGPDGPGGPDGLTASERMRWAKEEAEANIVMKVCNSYNNFAPCSCEEILTNMAVYSGGRPHFVEFPEYTCNSRQNDERKSKGLVPPGRLGRGVNHSLEISVNPYEKPEISYTFGRYLFGAMLKVCHSPEGVRKTAISQWQMNHSSLC